MDTFDTFVRSRVTTGSVAARDISDALLRRVLALSTASPASSYLSPIADAPGTVTLIRDAIRELIAEEIDATDFEQVATTTELPELLALADLYKGYMRELEKVSLTDSTGATSALAAGLATSGLAPDPILVDGFQFLRAGELRLVIALSRGADVFVTLDLTAGPRAVATHEALLAAGASDQEYSAPAEFRSGVEATSLTDDDAQLRAIARDIKLRLTQESGLRPSDFAVTFRQVTPHLGHARQVFREFNLPLDAAAGVTLDQTALGMWLLRLLRLGVHGWRQEEVVEFFSSAFINRQQWQLTRGDINRVRRRARREHLWAGLDELRLAASAPAAEQSEDNGSGGADGSAFHAAVDRLAAVVAQPEQSAGAHATAIDGALFGADPLVRAIDKEAYPDAVAVAGRVRGELRSFAAVDEALGERAVRFEDFVAALEERLATRTIVLREAGGVLLAPMHTLHGLRFAHVYVGGLSQGEFPAPQRPRGLLDERARAARATAGLELPPADRATEDELWRSVVTRAEQRTSLWRSRIDAEGRSRGPSYYFIDNASSIDDIEADPPPEDAASARELSVLLSRGWRDRELRRLDDLPTWSTIREAVTVEAQRRSWAASSLFEGDLRATPPAPVFDAETRWSASRLETYRTCAFQFFGRYVLRLTELDQEHDAVDAATRGTVIHAMLEEALGPIVEAGGGLTGETLAGAVERLHRTGPEIWDRAPREHGFGRAALWRIQGPETIDALAELLEREAQRNDVAGVTQIVGLEQWVDTTLQLPDGSEIAFQGGIDRLDSGDDVIQVVDYKSGRRTPIRELDDGRRLQLQLYAAAAAQEQGVEHVRALRCARRTPTPSPSG